MNHVTTILTPTGGINVEVTGMDTGLIGRGSRI
jgi:hypothetical protein